MLPMTTSRPTRPARPSTRGAAKTTTASKTTRAAPEEALSPAIDLEHYVPAYLTWVANKLSRGASQHYLALFGVGIETWRCLVLLALHGSVTAQQVSKVIGMDKGAVSRCFKSMQEQDLIQTKLDAADGRVRVAVLTPEGRALHDRIREVHAEAPAREPAGGGNRDAGVCETPVSESRSGPGSPWPP